VILWYLKKYVYLHKYKYLIVSSASVLVLEPVCRLRVKI